MGKRESEVGQGLRWGVTEAVKERARETRAKRRREVNMGTQKEGEKTVFKFEIRVELGGCVCVCGCGWVRDPMTQLGS